MRKEGSKRFLLMQVMLPWCNQVRCYVVDGVTGIPELYLKDLLYTNYNIPASIYIIDE